MPIRIAHTLVKFGAPLDLSLQPLSCFVKAEILDYFSKLIYQH